MDDLREVETDLEACLRLGVSPSHWMGGPPAWDEADRGLVRAYLVWKAQACPQCGRPLADHEEETLEDYHTGHYTCPATQALDKAQKEQAEADKKAIDEGFTPDRARLWVTWRDGETPPGDEAHQRYTGGGPLRR